MADAYTIINGHNIKLVDNGDGTYSVASALTGSNIEQAYASVVGTGEIANGNSETLDIIPPTGYAYIIESIWINILAPGGAGPGTHSISLKKGTRIRPSILYGSTAHNKVLSFNYNEWTNTVDNKAPVDAVNQQLSIKGILITVTDFLRFSYSNTSGAAQTNNREIYIYGRKVRVIS